MTYFFRHPDQPADLPEPLPTEFSDDLAHVDALLGRDAAVSARDVPTGMGDRLFAASVRHLPKRRERSVLRFSEAPILRSPGGGASLWPRLALAACVGLAFVIAAIALYSTGPGVPAGAPSVASVETVPPPHASSVVSASSASFDSPQALTPDEERLLFDASLAYLLDTRDLTLGELVNDIARIEREVDG